MFGIVKQAFSSLVSELLFFEMTISPEKNYVMERKEHCATSIFIRAHFIWGL